MPHFVIEYSNFLNKYVQSKLIIDAVYSAAVKSDLFSIDDIKVRLSPINEFTVGGSKLDFIHITIKLMEGRGAVKLNALKSLVAGGIEGLLLPPLSLSVELVEIDKDKYLKRIIGQKEVTM